MALGMGTEFYNPVTDVAELYRAAANLLETKGWGRGRAVGINGVLCVTAAINLAAVRPAWAVGDDIHRPLAEWLVANRRDEVVGAYRLSWYGYREDPVNLVGTSPQYLVQMWNDASMGEGVHAAAARTRDEVVRVLREVADHLESTEG